jgi:threonine/homoserine/homoserine lactone efflux protein
VKYLGVAYLLWMAWSTFREHGALVVEEDAAPVPARRVLASGVLVNILNPKLTIFFFAFLPQFVPADEPGNLVRMAGLSAVFMAMTFVVFAVYGVFAAAVRRHVIARPRVVTWMRRTFAGSFRRAQREAGARVPVDVSQPGAGRIALTATNTAVTAMNPAATR